MAPLQMLVELALLFLLGSGVAWVFERLRFPLGQFSKVIGFFAIFVWYFTWQIFPPLPSSLLAIYLTGIGMALLGWASSNDRLWKGFCRPVLAVLDGVNIPARSCGLR